MEPNPVITPLQRCVLRTYLETGNQRVTYRSIPGVTTRIVNDAIKSLYVLGILVKRADNRHGYDYSGMPYTVEAGEVLESTIPPPPPVVVTVEISERERQWMTKNYSQYSRRRREAAKILGRTVFELNLMAIAMELDKGDEDELEEGNE